MNNTVEQSTIYYKQTLLLNKSNNVKPKNNRLLHKQMSQQTNNFKKWGTDKNENQNQNKTKNTNKNNTEKPT